MGQMAEIEAEEYLKEERNMIDYEMHMIEASFDKLKEKLDIIFKKKGYFNIKYDLKFDNPGLNVYIRNDYWKYIDLDTLKKIERITGKSFSAWDDFDEDCGQIYGYKIELIIE